ncbi:MAG: Uroporphyrinogen deCOase protein [Chloroflexota bacterium]|nr:Uroporphyrinogen deCOase protein [Chloroflexota bacterium]
MLPRERLLTACRRGQPDRVPYIFSVTPPVQATFERETGASDLAEYFAFDCRSVGAGPTRKQTDFRPYFADIELPPATRFDEWGIAETPPAQDDPLTRHFRHRTSPLRHAATLAEIEAYPLPDLDADYRFAGMAAKVAAYKARGLAVQGGLGFSTFDHAWLLRGIDQFMMDMIANPPLAEALLDRVLALLRNTVRQYVAAGVDIIIWGEDVGTERAMMISPGLWRRMIKPRFHSMIRAAKEINPDVVIWYHSCGYIEPIIPDLIEIGVETLNPIQPETMDPAQLKARYGDRLAFWGGVSVQRTMPFGAPEQVRAEVKERIATVGRNGGYIIAPAHTLEPEVPWQNVLAFVEAALEYGRY